MCTDSHQAGCEWSKRINKEETNGAFYNVLKQQLVAPCWQLFIPVFMIILTEILEATDEAKYPTLSKDYVNVSVLISSQ